MLKFPQCLNGLSKFQFRNVIILRWFDQIKKKTKVKLWTRMFDFRKLSEIIEWGVQIDKIKQTKDQGVQIKKEIKL